MDACELFDSEHLVLSKKRVFFKRQKHSLSMCCEESIESILQARFSKSGLIDLLGMHLL